MLTRDEVQRALPASLKSSATQTLTDQINNVIADPIIAEHVRNNFISYAGVMKEGKFKIDDYLRAVMYVSYKLMGHTNLDAYAKTFPKRYADLIARGAPSKDISAYVSVYHKGKLVNLIMEQSLTPVWVLNQEIYQKAINTQADLMLNAQSEKVRSDAANSLLTHLGKPKDSAIAVNVNVQDNSGMNELKDTLHKLAVQQQELIENGVSAKSIASQTIIDAEPIENGTN